MERVESFCPFNKKDSLVSQFDVTSEINFKRPSLVFTNLKEFLSELHPEVSKKKETENLNKRNSKSSESTTRSPFTSRPSLNTMQVSPLDVFINFRRAPPIFTLITKFFDEQIENFIHYTKTYLEYENCEAFIFIFKSGIYITKIFDESSPITITPLKYKVKYKQIFHKELDIVSDQDECNSIKIQFYENDMAKKSEM